MGNCYDRPRHNIKKQPKVINQVQAHIKSEKNQKNKNIKIKVKDILKIEDKGIKTNMTEEQNIIQIEQKPKPKQLIQDIFQFQQISIRLNKPKIKSKDQFEIFQKNNKFLDYIIGVCEKNIDVSSEQIDQKNNKDQAKKSVKQFLKLVRITQQQFNKNPKVLCEIITNYYREVIENKVQRHMITQAQFKTKINEVKIFQKNPHSKYKIKRKLGKGGSCEVFLAQSRSDSRKYAVRALQVKGQKIFNAIKKEIALMNLCSSSYVIKYHQSYFYKNVIYMFIEFMDKGSLTDFIYSYEKSISEDIIAYILKQILKGLKVLHQNKQIHRDIKSDNILISKEGNIKLGDFGFAIQLTKQHEKRVSVVGTPAWMAPQLIQRKQYNQSIDIWSLGILAFQLLESEPPNIFEPHMKILFLTVSSDPPILKNASQQFQDFTRKCLQKEPSKRATINQLLNHRFIQSIGDGKSQKQIFVKMLSKVEIN